MSESIKTFKAGTIFNPLPQSLKDSKPFFHKIRIEYPSRLNAMALDPSKVALAGDMKYNAGQITFCINICKDISITILKNKNELEITNRSKRKALIKHVALLMRSALNFKEGLLIDVANENELEHIGLGTSGAIAGGVAVAINELYGNKLKKEELLRYLAQNYGEEAQNSEDFLAPVQCIGGSIASGLWEGNMLLIAGENEVVKTANFLDFNVVLGIPKNLKKISLQEALKKEVESMQNFIECGKKYGQVIAYQVLHKVLPAMNTGDLKAIGDVVYDYRFNMGSIKNCSFLYPELEQITKRLAFLKTKEITEVLAISSVGPLIFAITKRKKECIEAFKKEDLEVVLTTLRNKPYKILEIS